MTKFFKIKRLPVFLSMVYATRTVRVQLQKYPGNVRPQFIMTVSDRCSSTDVSTAYSELVFCVTSRVHIHTQHNSHITSQPIHLVRSSAYYLVSPRGNFADMQPDRWQFTTAAANTAAFIQITVFKSTSTPNEQLSSYKMLAATCMKQTTSDIC